MFTLLHACLTPPSQKGHQQKPNLLALAAHLTREGTRARVTGGVVRAPASLPCPHRTVTVRRDV